MKVTMRDVADHANVSLSTVSRALTGSGYVSDETLHLILKACEELNYNPAGIVKHMRSQSNIIGVITADLKNEFNVYVLEGITKVADANGYDVIVFDAQERLAKEERALTLFTKLPLKAIILTPVMDTQTLNYELLGVLESLKIPIVLVDRDLKYSNFDAVFLDNVTGACDAVNTLINCGHQKIATVTGTQSSLTGRDRYVGYKKAMYLNNLTVEERYVQNGEFTTEGGYRAMKALLRDEDPPTAVFVANMIMMRGCIAAMEEEHIRVPEDMAVMSFDDLPDCRYTYELSVVTQPMEEMGRTAMNILLERLREPGSVQKETRHVILPPKILLRGSEKYIPRPDQP